MSNNNPFIQIAAVFFSYDFLERKNTNLLDSLREFQPTIYKKLKLALIKYTAKHKHSKDGLMVAMIFQRFNGLTITLHVGT